MSKFRRGNDNRGSIIRNQANLSSQIAIIDDVSVFNSVGSSTVSDFSLDDFHLPERETFRENVCAIRSIESNRRHRIERHAKASYICRLTSLDADRNVQQNSSTTDSIASFDEKKKRPIYVGKFKLRQIKAESEAKQELEVIKKSCALSLHSSLFKEELDEASQLYPHRPSYSIDHMRSLDHPKLGSQQEFAEDLRHERLERWCRSRFVTTSDLYSNKNKRSLRKWFLSMDIDGSGEVSVKELEDPLLSTGIFKTREQVSRVLCNVDRNNTQGIDFEEFLTAIQGNKIADAGKVRQLQRLAEDPQGFRMDTLLTEQRRRNLLKSIVGQSERRERAFDQVFRKLDNNRMSRRDRERAELELQKVEEKNMASASLHRRYVNALDEVVATSRQVLDQSDRTALRSRHRIQQEQQRAAFQRVTQYELRSSPLWALPSPSTLGSEGDTRLSELAGHERDAHNKKQTRRASPMAVGSLETLYHDDHKYLDMDNGSAKTATHARLLPTLTDSSPSDCGQLINIPAAVPASVENSLLKYSQALSVKANRYAPYRPNVTISRQTTPIMNRRPSFSPTSWEGTAPSTGVSSIHPSTSNGATATASSNSTRLVYLDSLGTYESKIIDASESIDVFSPRSGSGSEQSSEA